MTHFITRGNQPLIGVFRQEKGREIVQYFSDEAEADEASSLREIREALRLAGAWSDLNWDEVEKELYRIRHESQPTPPTRGTGLIGDIDTLIAATALERNLTVITADTDYLRVPDLRVKVISLK